MLDNTGYGAVFFKSSNTTGALNTAVGKNALGASTTCMEHCCWSTRAIGKLTPQVQKHAAFGYQALKENTTGGNNTATGRTCRLHKQHYG